MIARLQWRIDLISGGSRISRRGGVDLVEGAVDPRGGYVSKILHVKTIESGPVGGGGARRARPPLDPPMLIIVQKQNQQKIVVTYWHMDKLLNLCVYIFHQYTCMHRSILSRSIHSIVLIWIHYDLGDVLNFSLDWFLILENMNPHTVSKWANLVYWQE